MVTNVHDLTEQREIIEALRENQRRMLDSERDRLLGVANDACDTAIAELEQRCVTELAGHHNEGDDRCHLCGRRMR